MSGGISFKHQPLLGNRALGFRAVQVLAYVRVTIELRGYSPSYGEIRDALGFNDKCDVRDVVKRLERRGLMSRAGVGRVRPDRPLQKQPVLRLIA